MLFRREKHAEVNRNSQAFEKRTTRGPDQKQRLTDHCNSKSHHRSWQRQDKRRYQDQEEQEGKEAGASDLIKKGGKGKWAGLGQGQEQEREKSSLELARAALQQREERRKKRGRQASQGAHLKLL